MTVKALMSALTCHVAEERQARARVMAFRKKIGPWKFNRYRDRAWYYLFDGTCRTLAAAFRFAEEDSVMPKRAKKAGKK